MLWRINQAPSLPMRFAMVSCITEGKKAQEHRGGIYHREGVKHTSTGKGQAADEKDGCAGRAGGDPNQSNPLGEERD